jgi:hypothetical protein
MVLDLQHAESRSEIPWKFWCFRWMKKTHWTDRVKNEVLTEVEEERNNLPTMEQRKSIWISHILCRNCLPKHVFEGKKWKIEVMERREKRRKKLLDDLKETRRYWKLKDEALDCTMRRNRFGRAVGPALRLTAWWYVWNCGTVFRSWFVVVILAYFISYFRYKYYPFRFTVMVLFFRQLDKSMTKRPSLKEHEVLPE